MLRSLLTHLSVSCQANAFRTHFGKITAAVQLSDSCTSPHGCKATLSTRTGVTSTTFHHLEDVSVRGRRRPYRPSKCVQLQGTFALHSFHCRQTLGTWQRLVLGMYERLCSPPQPVGPGERILGIATVPRQDRGRASCWRRSPHSGQFQKVGLGLQGPPSGP